MLSPPAKRVSRLHFGQAKLSILEPATHQFLLPQLEKSPLPLKPTERGERALDYISRQIFLHLRVSLFYVQGSHLSLSAKLLALMESKEYVYQAAESVFSMQSILRDFAHTYGNMNASQLTGISEQLYMASERYNAPELRALARQIVLEARIKNDLATGIQLMHLRCVEDIEKLSQRLHSSVVTDPSDITSPDTVSSAEDLVDYALLLSLRRILIDATDRKANIARKKMGELAKAHPTLVQDFEDIGSGGRDTGLHVAEAITYSNLLRYHTLSRLEVPPFFQGIVWLCVFGGSFS